MTASLSGKSKWNITFREVRIKYEIIHLYKAIEDVKGPELLMQAKEKRNELGGDRHIIEVLAMLKILTEEESAEIAYEAFKPHLPTLEIATFDELKLRDGKAYKGDKEVKPCIVPTVGSTDDFVILPFSDYKKYENLKSDTNKGHTTKTAKRSVDRAKSHYVSSINFKDVVKIARDRDVSDIHITYGEKEFNILFRINGLLEEQTDWMMKLTDGMALIKEIMLTAAEYSRGAFNAEALYKGQDGRIEYDDLGVDLRVAITPDGTLKKASLVARVLKKTSIEGGDYDFVKNMNHSPEFEKRIKQAIKQRGGLFVASGVTGSGKSSLVSRLLSTVNENQRVFTIEDPVEYRINRPNTTQHQIYVPKQGDDDAKDKKMGFLEYVRMLKRSDPDVAFVGEMRKEKELVDALVELSEAGQLIMTTAHFRSAFNIFFALEKAFGVPYETAVNIVLFSTNQTLVQSLCPHCKKLDTENVNAAKLEELKNNKEIRYAYTKPLNTFLKDVSMDGKTYIVGDGCVRCGGTGYLGRVPVTEYFRMTQDFLEKLLSNKMKPFEIENEACEMEIGENKLGRYIQLIREGVLDTSETIWEKIK
ncbi:MAG: Flp pilus assembly complex ATPase component TadA [Epsilonproteobacteria bacterium]|nr:Flp pilus assembly complex ATPase component TadA [Campylobacterota bacterium]